jgi:hypothetical protein
MRKNHFNYAIKRGSFMHDIKRILFVSRMTRDCRKAIHYGVALANMTGAELNVLHLFRYPIDFDMAGLIRRGKRRKS